jgi:hypothetical protein
MVESVLGNVGNTQVRMLPDLANLRLKFTSQQLDQGGLTGTIGTDNSDTRGKRTLHGDISKLLFIGTRVLEVNVLHLQDGTFLGLDTFKESRFGEVEDSLSGTQGVIGSGTRNLLDEFGKVTLITLQLVVTYSQ